jgi:hypothetical protein
MLFVVMLSVIMLSAIMLSVVAPINTFQKDKKIRLTFKTFFPVAVSVVANMVSMS